MVMHETLRALFLPKVLDRVRPQYVAHKPRRWWLAEPVQLRKQYYNVGTMVCGLVWEGLTLRMSSSVCSSGDSPP